MGQRVSRREQDAVEQLCRERAGTAGLVQCEGCPAGVLVHADPGVCEQHAGSYAHVAEQDRYETFDAAGNL